MYEVWYSVGMENKINNKTKYDIQYHKEKIKRIPFDLNTTHDADIIDFLNTVRNKNGFIKALIREYIQNETLM